MLSSCRPRLHGPARLLFGPGCWPRAPGGDQTLKGHQAKMRRAGLVVAHTSPARACPRSTRQHCSIARKLAGRGIDANSRVISKRMLARASLWRAPRTLFGSFGEAIIFVRDPKHSMLKLVSASLISSASTRIPSARSRHVVGSVNKDAGRGITALSDWEFPRLSRDSQTCHWCPVRRRP
jgi:hypothetical protein